MSAQFDFSTLPKLRVPLLVISPRRVLADILSKGWVESAVPLLAFVCVIVGVGVTVFTLAAKYLPIFEEAHEPASEPGKLVVPAGQLPEPAR